MLGLLGVLAFLAFILGPIGFFLGLGVRARLSALEFEPTTGLADSAPEAAAALISPQANVRFDSARLVVVQ